MIRRLFITFTSLFLIAILSGQSTERITLLGVEVLGSKYVSDVYIQKTSGLVIGREILPGDFAAAVKKLWDSNAFGEIQITLDEETEEGIYIIIEVVENPELGKIDYIGDKKKIFIQI